MALLSCHQEDVTDVQTKKCPVRAETSKFEQAGDSGVFEFDNFELCSHKMDFVRCHPARQNFDHSSIAYRKMGRVGELRAASLKPAFMNADAVPVKTKGAGCSFFESTG